MTNTYVIYFSGEEKIARLAAEKYIDEPTLSYAMNTHNEKLRASRLIAYSLLFYICRERYGLVDFSLYRDENNKPHILLSDGKKINISLSHDGLAAAVTVTDKPISVGVDIQREREPLNARKLTEKYFKNADILNPTVDLKIHKVMLRDDGTITPCMSDNNDGNVITPPDSFCARWALYEAAVKCDGRGIGARDALDVLADKYTLAYTSITVENKLYHLATATEKHKS